MELNDNEIKQIALTNCLKMIERRGLIKNHIDIYKKLNMDENEFNFDKFNIIYINQKINSITNKSDLDNFFSSNVDKLRIALIKKPENKVFTQSYKDYPNSQVFRIYEMLEDIIEKDIIPEHQLLNEKEKTEFLKNITLKELSVINKYDMMSRYFNAKEDDIFRILRPNPTTGLSVFYRKVGKSKIDFLFN